MASLTSSIFASFFASIEVNLIPESVSSRDRVHAAAIKRIEAASEADDPHLARNLLDEAGALVPTVEDLTRLERRASPPIVVAAVRIGDWELARSVAARYVAAEPDPLEWARLATWLELRESCSGEPECSMVKYVPAPSGPGSVGTLPY